MADEQTFDVNFMRVQEIEGKDYRRMEFDPDIRLGAYNGNQAMIWKGDIPKVTDLVAKARGKDVAITVQASTKNPEWSPTLRKVIVKDTGEIAFEASQGGGRGGGGGGGYRGPGDYESTTERLFRAMSIEAQSAAKMVAEFAMPNGGFGDEFDALVIRVATAIRRAAESHQGAPTIATILGQADARKTAQAAAQAPQQASPAPAPAGGNGQSTGAATEVVDAAVGVYGSRANLKAAYEYLYGDGSAPASLNDVPIEQLSELIDQADDIRPNL